MNSASVGTSGHFDNRHGSATANTVRILHTSDWQLGMKFAALGDDGQARFREARLAAIERLFEVAKEKDCAAIVVAGDVFDDNLLDQQVYRRAMDVLAGAPCPVYLLPGNHDPLDASSIYGKQEFKALASRDAAPVIVLDDTTPREIPGREDALAPAFVVGAPLKSKRASEDLVRVVTEELRAGRTGGAEGDGPEPADIKNWDARINIVVGHGAVEGFGRAYDPSLISVEAAANACRERVMDYVALGDTHSAMELHTDSTVWYSGAPEVTAYREPDGGGESNSCNVLIVDLAVDAVHPDEPAQVAVEEVRVGQWKFQALAAELNSRQDVEDFLAEVESLENKRQVAAKYAFKGALSLEDNAYLEDRLGQLKDGFAALYPRESRMELSILMNADQFSEESFGMGFVGQAARSIAEWAENDAVAHDALKLLFRIHSMNAQKGA
ncbi:DNA repair exonuclease [uncultured Corynebacterium sp.]|uniref:metallophosphoesterase family protein n=1 Tax=uncultured Corynebacterium sp. TaxID=159447 RepID=UPI0026000AC5|nr:DNA repair exonuclease [uncultured Corynebacterium sp.]